MARGSIQRFLGCTFIVTYLVRGMPGSSAPAIALAQGTVIATGGALLQKGQGQGQVEAALAQRRRELYDLQRQDVAAALTRDGVNVKWQQHSLAEMRDWQDRLRATRALRTELSVYMDWRITALVELTEIRLRAAKAVEIAEDFGVRVDWPRYSWSELETLRRHLAQLNSTQTATKTVTSPADADALAIPWTSNRKAASSTSVHSPDAIVEPTFAVNSAWVGMQRRARSGRPVDPDAILIPTFAVMSTSTVTPSRGADDIIDPFKPALRGAGSGR